MKLNLKEWIKGKQMFGVTLCVEKEDCWFVDVVELYREKNEIKLIDKGDELTSVEILWEKIPKNSPISLSLIGNGILLKTVSADQVENGIEGALPNIRREEFVIQQMEMSRGRCLFALIRKDVLSVILKHFQEHEIWVVDLYLGPVCLQIVSPLFLDEDQLFILSGWKVQFVGGKLEYCQKTEAKPDRYYHIGGEDLWGNQLMPFASALSTMASGNQNESSAEVKELAAEFFARKLLLKGVVAALIFIFITVLINFFVFDSLRQQQSSLFAQVETGRNLLLQLDVLKNDVQQKNNFLLKSGLNAQSKLSFYADRIANDLPQGVRLTSMELNPVENKIKKGKEIKYKSKFILIQGETTYPLDLNLWIRNLKKEEWVRKVSRQEYLLRQKNEPAYFVIEIEVK
jgi:Tfp pilus assembly protein PilN